MRKKSLLIIFSILCCLTVFTVLGSVIFRVQVVEAYCYNATDEELENKVLNSHKIKMGKNIFLISEQEVIDNVYKSVNNIRIVNVERKFPNRIYINYIKELEYVNVEFNNDFYMFSNSGKLIRTLDSCDQTQSVKLKVNNNLTALNIGDKFSTDYSQDSVMFDTVMAAFEYLRPAVDVIEMFEFVDISKNFLYFKTRSGLYFEVQSSAFLLDKLRFGWDTYTKYLNDGQRKTGTLIISGTARADWSSEIKYK